MNKYTLRFENQSMEDLYLQDQFKELFNFYTWACFLGSISAFSVFCLEFLVPFGFNEWAYTLLLIPFAFALSRKFIEVFPQYFNITLAIINILLGALISILLCNFSNSNILFLAGQTVAMVQQSLMLGSNIMINILILLINQIGLMILGSLVQNYFNSLQLMFILSLILVIKSVWSNEKMKRNFFLLKHQNFQLHKHLDNVFQLKILRCKLEHKTFKLNLLSKNKQAEHLIKDQKDFTHFIREYVQVFIRTQTLQGQLQTPRKITLEQVLFKMIEIEDNEKTIQIYSFRTKIAFKITIYKIIENEETNLILLLQEDIDYEKVMKLNQQLKKSQIIQKKLFECQESVQQSFKYLKYYVHFLEVKGNPYQNRDKKQNSTTHYNSVKFLDNSQNLLLKSIFGYYNCLIYNNELLLFKKIINFSKKRLIAEFCRLKRIFELKRTVKIKSDQSDFNMESNLTLLLQLLLNLVSEQFRFREYDAIDINMSPIQVEGFKVIIFKLTLIYSQKNEHSMDYDNTFQYDLVNQKILKQIGWKKEIRIVYEQTCDIIEFQLLQSVIDFSK